jgi:hypothetical protein
MNETTLPPAVSVSSGTEPAAKVSRATGFHHDAGKSVWGAFIFTPGTRISTEIASGRSLLALGLDLRLGVGDCSVER